MLLISIRLLWSELASMAPWLSWQLLFLIDLRVRLIILVSCLVSSEGVCMTRVVCFLEQSSVVKMEGKVDSFSSSTILGFLFLSWGYKWSKSASSRAVSLSFPSMIRLDLSALFFLAYLFLEDLTLLVLGKLLFLILFDKVSSVLTDSTSSFWSAVKVLLGKGLALLDSKSS